MRNLCERLERLEKAVPCDLVAFFSVPDKYSGHLQSRVKF